MDADEAATCAQRFLDAYLEENDWFTASDQVVRDYLKREYSLTNVLMLFGTMPKDGGVFLTFFHGRDVDPQAERIDRTIKKCLIALKKAHPEVAGFKLEYELRRE